MLKQFDLENELEYLKLSWLKQNPKPPVTHNGSR